MPDKKEEGSSADVPPHPRRPAGSRGGSFLPSPRAQEGARPENAEGPGGHRDGESSAHTGSSTHGLGAWLSCEEAVRTNPSSETKAPPRSLWLSPPQQAVPLPADPPKTRHPNGTDSTGVMATGLHAGSRSPAAAPRLAHASAALPAGARRGRQQGLAG